MRHILQSTWAILLKLSVSQGKSEKCHGQGDVMTTCHDGWYPGTGKGYSVKSEEIWISHGPKLTTENQCQLWQMCHTTVKC